MNGKSSRKEMDEEGTSYFLKLGSYDALKLKEYSDLSQFNSVLSNTVATHRL